MTRTQFSRASRTQLVLRSRTPIDSHSRSSSCILCWPDAVVFVTAFTCTCAMMYLSRADGPTEIWTLISASTNFIESTPARLSEADATASGSLANLVTVIVTDSPSSARSEQKARGFVEITRVTLQSLRCYAPQLDVLIAFDGVAVAPGIAPDEFGFHFGAKCSSPRNASIYDHYITMIQDMAKTVLVRQPRYVLAPARRCLAGTLALALEATRAPFVLVTQNDRPLHRRLPWVGLLKTMQANPIGVQAVWLPPTSQSKEKIAEARACTGNWRVNDVTWANPALTPTKPLAGALVSLVDRRYWSDSVVFARKTHYTNVAWPALRAAMAKERAETNSSVAPPQAGFMEHHLFCKPFVDFQGWGTWNLVGSARQQFDSPYSVHLDNYMKQKHLASRFRGMLSDSEASANASCYHRLSCVSPDVTDVC